VPLLHLLGKTGITRLHGEWLEYNGIPAMPTFHPSYLMRSPARKRDAWEDLKKVMATLGRDPDVTMQRLAKHQHPTSGNRTEE
jgi:uracil-DNA glycosylase